MDQDSRDRTNDFVVINDFVVKVATVNGTGSASANGMLMQAIFRMGVPVSGKNVFPSNIQGLPTWYEIRVNKHGHLARSPNVDLMVAMNPKTYEQDIAEVRPGGAVLFDSSWPLEGELHRPDVLFLGIPVAQDLPGVGQNMRDHFSVGVLHGVKEGFPQDPHAPRHQICLCYTAEGSGTRNDMLITPSSFATDVPGGGDPMKSLGVALSTSLYLPVGVGELRLTSADPHAHPHMDYRYLVDPWDRQRLRESVRLCIRLLEHPAYRDMIKERISPTDEDLTSDDALDMWLLKNVTTSYHVSGTCKMGPASDQFAVTDQYLRVHGLERLRVVDASIMPNVIRANTNATTIMIGERAADLIKAQL